MGDTVKVQVWISTNKVGSKCEDTAEFDREEWESMTDDEKDDLCKDTAFNNMDWGWRVIE